MTLNSTLIAPITPSPERGGVMGRRPGPGPTPKKGRMWLKPPTLIADISCVEILLRRMRVRRGMTRPEHQMHAHTAYIVAARKAYRED